LTTRQIDFMTILDMDQGLVGTKGSRPSLEIMWKRYVVITEAIVKAGSVDWVSGSKKPADTEIISVYASKSSFYDQSKVLQHVKLFPDMLEWLERSDSNLDATVKLWGFYRTAYSLKDLENWIGKQHEEAQKDRKGKKKVTETRSHKKSGGRK
jgi:hypothetical protein